MQIKVNNTKTHVAIPTGSSMYHDIPVAEGKLVLLKNQPMKRGDVDSPVSDLIPIIISETEKIEEGDWGYNLRTKQLGIITQENVEKHGKFGYDKLFKVLVLPEQFSPKHLQAIVDGKLKDGDKILIECVDNGEEDWMGDNETGQPFWNSQYFIKLNSQGHVTLYPGKEEKMYTREEVQNILIEYVKTNPTKPYHPVKWFEQNVK